MGVSGEDMMFLQRVVPKSMKRERRDVWIRHIFQFISWTETNSRESYYHIYVPNFGYVNRGEIFNGSKFVNWISYRVRTTMWVKVRLPGSASTVWTEHHSTSLIANGVFQGGPSVYSGNSRPRNHNHLEELNGWHRTQKKRAAAIQMQSLIFHKRWIILWSLYTCFAWCRISCFDKWAAAWMSFVQQTSEMKDLHKS